MTNIAKVSEWIIYSGLTTNDFSGGLASFANGDLATAFSAENSSGGRFIVIQRISKTGDIVWSTQVDADYSPSIGSVLVGQNDRVYIVGSTKKGISGESGKNDLDVFAASLSSTGQSLWYKNYGIGIHEVGGFAGALDKEGNLYLNGRVSEVNDAYTFIKDVPNFYGAEFSSGWKGFQLKINSDDGNLIKAYTSGSYNSGGQFLAIDKSRNLSYVGGYTFGAVNGVSTIGNGDTNGANSYLIARDESTGLELWTRMENWIRSNIVVQEQEDAIYFIDKGVIEKVKGSTGQTLWTKSIANADYFLSAFSGGGILLSEYQSTGVLTIRHFDENGNEKASQSINHSGELYPTSFIEDGNGVLIISGSTSGPLSLPSNASTQVGKQPGLDGFLLQVASNFSSLANTTPIVRGNSLYTLVDGPSWTQAQANAVKIGGNLITVNDKGEEDFLYSYFGSNAIVANPISKDSGGLWTGLTDRDEEGDYKWISGDASTWLEDTYKGTGGWETSSDSPEQDYIILRRSPDSISGYDWDDYWITDVPWIGDMVHKGVAETPFIRRGNSAYVIVEGPTWEEAEANVNKLGGHLVTINDAAEQKWLEDQFSGAAWIGYTDRAIEGQWVWSDGSQSTYTNWRAGEPNNLGEEDYAATSLDGDGKWNDIGVNNFKGIAEIQLAPNNTPTGLPSLIGTKRAGSTLTIDASLIRDTDNFAGWTPSYSYAWEVSSNSGLTWSRLTSTDATDNNSTYRLNNADAGKRIRGVVSYLDGYGTTETVLSAASTVLAVTPGAPGLALAADTGSSATDRITNNGRINVSGLVVGASWRYSLNAGSTWFNGTNSHFIVNPGSYATGQIRVQHTSNGITSPINSSFAAFTLDRTAPLPLSLGLAVDTGSSATDQITRNGRINVGGLETKATWEYSVNGGTTWLAGVRNFFTLNEGRYVSGQVRVRQKDVAGNTSPVNTSFGTIVVDNTAPTLTIASIGGTDQKVSSVVGDNVVRGTAEANQTVSIHFGTNLLGSAKANTNGVFAYSLTTPNLEFIRQGNRKTIQARATDVAGNTGTSAPFSFAVETRSGGASKDNLTGMVNRADNFIWNGRDDSLFARYDSISNFEKIDRIEFAEEQYNANLKASIGSITSFSLANIKTLLSATAFQANKAVAFTANGMNGTFVALNDSRGGFQEATDGLLFLSSYQIGSTNPVSII